jgi:anti-sigma-K factor RskA
VGASSYISSGLVEVYISGLASSREQEELELAMAQHPELAAAVNDCRHDMEQYIILQSVNPPAVIKENLLKIVAGEETERIHEMEMAAQQPTETPVVTMRTGNPWRWVAAASIVLLAVSLYMNYQYYNSSNDYKAKYEALATEHTTVVAQNDVYRTSMQQMQQSLDIVKDPAMHEVKMPGTKPFPQALATVYWNQASKEVFLMVNNLPLPSSDKQYQLWAIVAGKPVDMGVFDAGTDNAKLLQKMKTVDNAEMFAVTLEKKGGSPVPTMDQMYVAGKI